MSVELTKDTSTIPSEINVPAEPPIVRSIGGSRLKSLKAFIVQNRSFIALVVVPFLVALIYFTVIASDRYVSTAEIIVKDNSSSSAMPSAMDFLLAGSSSNTQDALLVVNYIHSLDNERLALKIFQYQKELNKEVKLFIQVNLANEDQKSGLALNSLHHFYNYS